MSGRINQVEDVFLAIVQIFHLYGFAFDGNSAFTFQIHVVQYLFFGFAFGDGFGYLKQPVCQRALSVVNMGNDAKVSNVLHAAKIQ